MKNNIFKFIDLDNFKDIIKLKRKILFSKENNIAKRISKFLTIDQRRKISKLTFTHGFDTVRYHTFNYEKLKKIKECWK